MRAGGILLLTLALGACAQVGPSDDETAREAELTIRSLMAAWERGDQELLEELFWPEATYDDFPNQHTYQGVQEIIGYVDALHAWADDVLWNVGRVHVTESGAVAEWVFSAVQARPIGNQVSIGTGAEVVTNGVTIIELEGSRIIRAADYTDTAPMLLQLGSRIELPGGTVLELDDGR
ncbi:MAG: nuclear transport factor 2 family protein [Gemmatimonadota bacterium]